MEAQAISPEVGDRRGRIFSVLVAVAAIWLQGYQVVNWKCTPVWGLVNPPKTETLHPKP